MNADPASADGIALDPLTMPPLAGPGTIATMIVPGHTAFSSGRTLAFAFVAFLVLPTTALLAAPFIGHDLSPRVTADSQRLTGMIRAAIALRMIGASRKAAFGLH
ncbi:MarC family protein [Burkholderia sp. BCC1977]|uniref:MarC family protein n=1 Tax=Burkholderia sp. BCC1977 TaxID=2817440 RepID=UPI002ABD1DA9|nr:MarC family protein [Burkholderia sp. BCC1977]